MGGGLGTPGCRARPWAGGRGADGQKAWAFPEACNETENRGRPTAFSRSKALCAATCREGEHVAAGGRAVAWATASL